MDTAALPLDAARWSPPKPPPFAGVYARNERLARAELWPATAHGPEDVNLDAEGRLVTGVVTGELLVFPKGGGAPRIFARTGGRPLGIERYDDAFVVCDARVGLLRVDLQGRVETLARSYEGRPFRFCNNACVARDGTVYFTDSSTRHGIEQFRLDLLEHQPRGRLFAYDPKTRDVRLVKDGLYFANGVALSRDESFLVVAETSMYRLLRVWLRGPRAGQTEVFVENLPGFPDNISSTGRGVFWVALPAPRNAALDTLAPHPWARRVVARLPERLQPQPQRYGFVLAIDEDGNVVENLQDPSGRLAELTGAREHDGRLYIGSLTETAVAVVDL